MAKQYRQFSAMQCCQLQMETFLDSHVKFFEMVCGVYREVVYDNMRNVVAKFIGRNEKELNPKLLALSTYYGYTINVTNCFAGNEKGYVEGSVKTVRNGAFAVRYRFETFEEAQLHLEAKLLDMNAGSSIGEERRHLMPRRPALDIARVTSPRVDKYSFVRVENNFYSVPEHLVGRRVTAKSYPGEVVVFSGLCEVCRHKKNEGFEEMSVDIIHYLDTLSKKPGALRNSKALRSEAGLKAVFDRHFSKRPREFIELLREHSSLPMDEILRVCEAAGTGAAATAGVAAGTVSSNVMRHTKGQLHTISDFFTGGGGARGH